VIAVVRRVDHRQPRERRWPSGCVVARLTTSTCVGQGHAQKNLDRAGDDPVRVVGFAAAGLLWGRSSSQGSAARPRGRPRGLLEACLVLPNCTPGTSLPAPPSRPLSYPNLHTRHVSPRPSQPTGSLYRGRTAHQTGLPASSPPGVYPTAHQGQRFPGLPAGPVSPGPRSRRARDRYPWPRLNAGRRWGWHAVVGSGTVKPSARSAARQPVGQHHVLETPRRNSATRVPSPFSRPTRRGTPLASTSTNARCGNPAAATTPGATPPSARSSTTALTRSAPPDQRPVQPRRVGAPAPVRGPPAAPAPIAPGPRS